MDIVQNLTILMVKIAYYILVAFNLFWNNIGCFANPLSRFPEPPEFSLFEERTGGSSRFGNDVPPPLPDDFFNFANNSTLLEEILEPSNYTGDYNLWYTIGEGGVGENPGDSGRFTFGGGRTEYPSTTKVFEEDEATAAVSEETTTELFETTTVQSETTSLKVQETTTAEIPDTTIYVASTTLLQEETTTEIDSIIITTPYKEVITGHAEENITTVQGGIVYLGNRSILIDESNTTSNYSMDTNSTVAATNQVLSTEAVIVISVVVPLAILLLIAIFVLWLALSRKNRLRNSVGAESQGQNGGMESTTSNTSSTRSNKVNGVTNGAHPESEINGRQAWDAQ